MNDYNIDIIVKVYMLPLTEFEFYEFDYINELFNSQSEKEYYNKYYDKILTNIIKIINKTQHIKSLDEIHLLMQRFYSFYHIKSFESRGYFSYMDILKEISSYLISYKDGSFILQHWVNKNSDKLFIPVNTTDNLSGINKVLIWNSLNRMFTTDLLIIRYIIDSNKSLKYLNNYYNNINIEDSQLKKILSKGVSDNHVHNMAAINFFISWQNDMNLNNKKKIDYPEFMFKDSLNNKEFDLQKYIPVFAVIRILLFYFVENRRDEISFKDFIKVNLKPFIRDVDIYQDKMDFVRKNNIFNKIIDLINKVFKGKRLYYEFYEIVEIWDYLDYLGVINNINETNSDQRDLFNTDIIYGIVQKDLYIDTVPENIFLYKVFKYIDYSVQNKKDYAFEKIFWQYIRIKNEVFKIKVQANRFKGLMYFRNFYKRATGFAFKSAIQHWRILLKNQFQNKNLKKVEFRLGFINKKSSKNIEREIALITRDYFYAYKEIIETDYMNSKFPLVGLIFNLSKTADDLIDDKCLEKSNYSGCDVTKKNLYYYDLQQQYFRQVKAFENLRRKIPELSKYLIGIDAASLETNTEPWVFAPVYSSIRNNSYDLEHYVKGIEKISDTKFTFHAGEDFRHLLSGIRRIDEIIEHFAYRPGDRIGHCISLGLNIDKWALKNRFVVMTKIEYMENLLWFWGLYKHSNFTNNIDSNYLESNIMKIAKEIYFNINGISIFHLWNVYKNKFKKISYQISKNKSPFCKFNKFNFTWNEDLLKDALHCKVYLRRMNEIIQVDINKKEIEILKTAQKSVRNTVSRTGIVIETNPSSNIIIANLNNIFEHHIFNLNSQDLTEQSDIDKSIIVTINSDDPAVFNTNVNNEFAYIFFALQKKGYSRENILKWIDKVRQYGLDFSFIDDRENETYDSIYKEICVIINKLS